MHHYFPTPADPSRPMQHDFTHDFGDGMMPDLFGPLFRVEGDPALPSNPGAVYTSGYADGKLVGAVNPHAGYPAQRDTNAPVRGSLLRRGKKFENVVNLKMPLR